MKNADTASLDLVPEGNPASTAIAHNHPTTIQDPVAKAIADMMQKGITTESVAALEKLSDLYLKLQANDAEKQFATAFNALQAEMPRIQANKPVPNNDGTVRYKFAPYEEIMEQVRPLLLKHGFTITFSSEALEGRIVQHCTLQHVAGHKRTNSFAARIGKGPPGSSETQGDGAASTYAKRFALCDCFNIVIEKDGDARNEGKPISKDKAMYLRERVKETSSDEKIFLLLAGVKASATPSPLSDYESIYEDKYDMLVAKLAAKEKKAKEQA